MLTYERIAARETASGWRMLVMHGLGDSLEGYRWLPEALNLPWLGYLLINAPDEYHGGYSWYDFQNNPAPGIARSRAEVFELLDAERAGGVPSEQTFVFGFSQGCLMTLETGMRYPHRLAGLVGVSGYVHEPERAVRELSPVAATQRFFVTLGTYDPLLPADRVKGQLHLLQKDGGLDIQWRELAKDHTIAGEEEIAMIRAFLQGCKDKAAGIG